MKIYAIDFFQIKPEQLVEGEHIICKEPFETCVEYVDHYGTSGEFVHPDFESEYLALFCIITIGKNKEPKNIKGGFETSIEAKKYYYEGNYTM